MKKKTKKPKDELIHNVLEDLKNETAEPSSILELEGLHSENDEKTTVLAPNDASHQSPFDFPSSPPSSKNTLDQTEPAGRVRGAQSSHSQQGNHKPISDSTDHTLVAPNRRGPAVEPKVSFGGSKGKTSPYEAQFAQAENLRIAQSKILQLEKEIEDLRRENELLSSANEVSRSKLDELISKVQLLEKQKHDLKETNESELRIFKEGLASKDHEIHRLRNKVDELENRLATDLRKVRVRERELENRLELAKAEKAALLRAKDENILELKRRIDNLEGEIENYQSRIIEMGQQLEGNQEQFARTVRALRIALTNLEVSDSTNPSITIAPLKKAE